MLVSAVGVAAICLGLLQPQPAQASDESRVELVYEFTEPVSLENAGSAIPSVEEGMRLDAIRFENGPIVGEFNPNGDIDAESYAGQFREMYGVEPAVVSVRVVPQDEVLTQVAPSRSHQQEEVIEERIDIESRNLSIPVEIPTADVLEGIVTTSDSANYGSQGKRAGVDPYRGWEPEWAEAGTWRSGAYQFFRIQGWWSAGYTTKNVPQGFGLEFGIDLYNNRGGGVRPACLPHVSEYFLGKMKAWPSWQMIVPGWTPGVGDAGVYADWNDLGDACNRRSFTLGARYAQRLPMIWAANKADVTVLIQAENGPASSNTVGAGIQMVDNGYCDIEPLLALTDCMGVLQTKTTAVEMYRPLLSAGRGWAASPSLCWRSYGFGLLAPEKKTC